MPHPVTTPASAAVIETMRSPTRWALTLAMSSLLAACAGSDGTPPNIRGGESAMATLTRVAASWI
jgi:hypothetical protein